MKLNVGCSWPTGRYKQDEWINLDIEPHRGVDIIADASKHIPLDTNSVDEIHCVHVLEHVTRDKFKPMLREMHRILKTGGHLYVETPDFRGTIDRLQTAFANNDVDAIHVWTTSVYGKNERVGMAHYMGFYEGLLRREFRHQGFKEVTRLTEKNDMISSHYKQEPVLLVRGTK
jgi:predicted SAM-dependent methyltransferase